MPTSEAPLTPDQKSPQSTVVRAHLSPEGDVVRSDGPYPSDEEDALVEELLASEGLAMANSGRIPDAAPGPSLSNEERVRAEYEAAEKRLQAGAPTNVLCSRLPQTRQTRNVAFYGDHQTKRQGIWLGESGADMAHWSNVDTMTLMANAHVLTQLAREAGVDGVKTSLQTAVLEARRRQRGPQFG